jgi:Mn2+/Fe2+ NRAMP family transporter
MDGKALRSTLVGAAFLMATSAIGPGFLTQTAVFTQSMGASFAFAIMVSIVVDLVAQLNIWRVLGVAELRAQDVANRTVPGSGWVLALLVGLGGFAFNIGNIGGTGLGLNALLGIDLRLGAVLSAALAIAIFLKPEAGRAMDWFAQLLGLLMIALALYVAVASQPPYGRALISAVAPDPRELLPEGAPVTAALLPIVTIVGGTVGGYITFAGAHRLIDAGVTGVSRLGAITRSASMAIAVASVMRIILFLGALGVVARGVPLDPGNPPADVFRQVAGTLGYRLFGLVMWAAAISSVVGSAYTSVSFLRTLDARIDRNWRGTTIGFIVLSTTVLLLVGRPVKVLIAVGALNALILPLGLALMLLATRKREVVADYHHPRALTIAGVVVAIAMAAMAAYTVTAELPKLWRA